MQTTFSFRLLQGAVSLVFLGRAWQFLFWDAPYRAFFWDEALLKPFIERWTPYHWNAYVTSSLIDQLIQGFIKGQGFLFLGALIATWILAIQRHWFWKTLLVLGGAALVLLAVLTTKEKFYHTAQFFEYSIQFCIPFIYVWCCGRTYTPWVLIRSLQVITALTFFSHGLYAFGWYPVPGYFVDMVLQIIGCSESQALVFLKIVGLLDFVLAVVLFIPVLTKYALWYAVVWGILTALARIVANFYEEFPWLSLHQYGHHVLYRIPHGLIPFLLLQLLPLYNSNRMYSEQLQSNA